MSKTESAQNEEFLHALFRDYRESMSEIFSAYKNRAELIPSFMKNLFLKQPREMQLDNLGNPIETRGFLFEYFFHVRNGDNALICEAEAKSILKEICAAAISSYPISLECMTEDLRSERNAVKSREELCQLLDEAEPFEFSAIEYALRPLVCEFVKTGKPSDSDFQKLFLTAEKILVRDDKNAESRNLGVFYSWTDFLEMLDDGILSEI